MQLIRGRAWHNRAQTFFLCIYIGVHSTIQEIVTDISQAIGGEYLLLHSFFDRKHLRHIKEGFPDFGTVKPVAKSSQGIPSRFPEQKQIRSLRAENKYF